MGRMLDACKEASRSDATFTWADADFLEKQGVHAWSDMPAWVPKSGRNGRLRQGEQRTCPEGGPDVPPDRRHRQGHTDVVPDPARSAAAPSFVRASHPSASPRCSRPGRREPRSRERSGSRRHAGIQESADTPWSWARRACNLGEWASPAGCLAWFPGRQSMKENRSGALAVIALTPLLLLSAAACEAAGETPVALEEDRHRGQVPLRGASIADVNKDGKLDILVGDSWYEAPAWTKHDIRKPGDYGDGLHSYSECMTCWADDINGDGWADQIVIGFPGSPAYWYENPKGKPGYWPQHEIWPSACNETPLYADLFGDGQRVLVMGWQPKGKDNEGQMAWFTPGSDPAQALGDAPGQRAQHVPARPIPGTFRFSHGLGVGDLNGDGRNDVICTGGWWEQPESGRASAAPWTFHPASLGDAVADMIAYDVNHDGKADVDRQLGPPVRHLVVRAGRREGRLARLHQARPLPRPRLRDPRPDRRGHQRRRPEGPGHRQAVLVARHERARLGQARPALLVRGQPRPPTARSPSRPARSTTRAASAPSSSSPTSTATACSTSSRPTRRACSCSSRREPRVRNDDQRAGTNWERSKV